MKETTRTTVMPPIIPGSEIWYRLSKNGEKMQ